MKDTMKNQILLKIKTMQATLDSWQTWLENPPLGIDKDEERYREALRVVIDDSSVDIREQLLDIEKLKNEWLVTPFAVNPPSKSD